MKYLFRCTFRTRGPTNAYTQSIPFGHPSLEENERGEPHIINAPHAIQRKWKIHTFADILYIYPHDLVPYPDATFDLTDMHNGIYLDNMVCHNSCQCLFSQI